MRDKISSGNFILLVTLSAVVLVAAACIQYFLAPLSFDAASRVIAQQPSPEATRTRMTATITLTALLPLPTPTITQTLTVTLTPTNTNTPTASPSVTSSNSPTATITLTSAPAGQTDGSMPSSAFVYGFLGEAQLFSLDCEARAAVDLAGFFGVKIDEIEFLNLLPISDDPNEGFVGADFNAETGRLPPEPYGVYAGPIADLLQYFGLNAAARTQMTLDELKTQIAAGKPVMVWVVGHVEPGVPIPYVPSNGNETIVAAQEHTVVITGYDREFVYIIDPAFNQFYMRTIERFLESWGVFNNMAVVVEDD